jgi:hypothetical protein
VKVLLGGWLVAGSEEDWWQCGSQWWALGSKCFCWGIVDIAFLKGATPSGCWSWSLVFAGV